MTSSSYRSEASELDFAESDKAVKTINDWAKEKTHDKIPEIVNKGLKFFELKSVKNLLKNLNKRNFWFFKTTSLQKHEWFY